MQLASGSGLWQRLTQSFGKYSVGQVRSTHSKLAHRRLAFADAARSSVADCTRYTSCPAPSAMVTRLQALSSGGETGPQSTPAFVVGLHIRSSRLKHMLGLLLRREVPAVPRHPRRVRQLALQPVHRAVLPVLRRRQPGVVHQERSAGAAVRKCVSAAAT